MAHRAEAEGSLWDRRCPVLVLGHRQKKLNGFGIVEVEVAEPEANSIQSHQMFGSIDLTLFRCHLEDQINSIQCQCLKGEVEDQCRCLRVVVVFQTPCRSLRVEAEEDLQCLRDRTVVGLPEVNRCHRCLRVEGCLLLLVAVDAIVTPKKRREKWPVDILQLEEEGRLECLRAEECHQWLLRVRG